MFRKIPLVPFVGAMYMGLLAVAIAFPMIPWLTPAIMWGTLAFLWVGGIYSWYHLYSHYSKIVAWLMQSIVLMAVIMRAMSIQTEGATAADRVLGAGTLWFVDGPFMIGFLSLAYVCVAHVLATPETKTVTPAVPPTSLLPAE